MSRKKTTPPAYTITYTEFDQPQKATFEKLYDARAFAVKCKRAGTLVRFMNSKKKVLTVI